jgi:hypothetical protein
MSTKIENLAHQVVAEFRAELSEDLIDRIGNDRLQRLEALVAQAVHAGLHHAAEQLDALSRSLRSGAAEDWDGMEL